MSKDKKFYGCNGIVCEDNCKCVNNNCAEYCKRIETKSSEDWLLEPEFRGIEILDPDGWDRKDFESSWEELITKKEMHRRLKNSTTQGKIGFFRCYKVKVCGKTTILESSTTKYSDLFGDDLSKEERASAEIANVYYTARELEDMLEFEGFKCGE
jgi:hypothetical protein